METMTLLEDATDRVLAEEIAKARDVLLEVASTEEDRWWTARELKVRARNGWSSGVMGLALRSLIEEGLLEQRRSDLQVRLRK